MSYHMVTPGDVAALRAAGLKVIEVNGWQERGHGPGAEIETLTVHHTAGPRRGNTPSLGVVVHGRGGADPLAGPLCNIYVARDGTLYIVAAGMAYHAGESRSTIYTNPHAVGFECEGTGLSAWPSKQTASMAKAFAVMLKRKNLKVADVRGHKETCAPHGRKSDPNFAMSAFRMRVTVAGGKKTKPSTTTQVQRLQALADVKADNIWGPVTDAAVSRLRGHCKKHPGFYRATIADVRGVFGVKPGATWDLATDSAFFKLRERVNGKR